MPIWFGPLRGIRWVVGSFIHKSWLGVYEYAKQQRFAQFVLPGHVVYDLGAHVGFYALLASVLVGEEGEVIAFEPLPRNLKYLKQHIEINRTSNVFVVEFAVSDKSGAMRFSPGSHHAMGQLSEHGSLSVGGISLDDYVSYSELPKPDVIKIDIEGGEYRALQGAESLLRQYRPIIFLATHGMDVHYRSCAFLAELGYRLEAIDGSDASGSREIIAIIPDEENSY